MKGGRIGRRVTFMTAAAFGLLLGAPAAFAQYPGGDQTPPAVGGERFFRGSEGVPRTGWDVLMYLLAGLLLLMVGLALRYWSRRATPSEG